MKERKDGLIPTGQIDSRFIRSINRDIAEFVLPDIRSGDANERAFFATLVLSRIADNDDVVVDAFATMGGDFVQIARQARDLAHRYQPDEQLPDVSFDLSLNDTVPADRRVFDLRALLGQCVRILSSIEDTSPLFAEARDTLDRVHALEARWLATKAAHQPVPPKDDAPLSVYDRVTPASVTDHLRNAFPDKPNIRATAVEVLPGGRSKKTIFITIASGDVLSGTVVMRQDTGMIHIGTSVVDEYPVLNAISQADLPIPAVYHFEPESSALGGPFMLMRRLPGKPTGSFPAFDNVSPLLVADVAQALARIHAIDPRAIGLPVRAEGVSLADSLAALTRKAWAQWQENAIEPSPIIEYGFDWLLRRCHLRRGGDTIVHGDYRPHNFLAEGERLTGILDWEFTHIGDHAEDLAYIRPVVLPIMPWADFMTVYRNSGGRDCDEQTLIFYEVWGVLRLCAMGAGAVRQFMDGRSEDFTQGAGGFFVIPSFEQQLADLIERARALEAIQIPSGDAT